ncbi:methyltransferase domain-containing protein [Fructobacillus sp. CRL 2054]|uniref:class I SAM-dependent methyltransferase n=1 Tax=Fructobacillus sp. CRL 2054 TaxID=2763007 RepID=UPI0023791446|nr:methyltransferase domain-containing protein [Fructobacillus sp. CRL 2054]MDD9138428.1 methyltransferase domain-containing protein [Fructobacillus sp. CRL 2054]
MKKGIDAPYALFGMSFVTVLLFLQALRTGHTVLWIFTIILFFSAITYFHTSYFGKYKIIKNAVQQLKIQNTDKILDLGTGHGIVLIEAAQYLEFPGQATGIDIWRNGDQSNNSIEETKSNISKLGYEKVANVATANMLDLPFADNSFDIVTASLAIHNLKSKHERAAALKEATRVLKPNGQLLIIDFSHDREYQVTLTEAKQYNNVQLSKTGYNGWWGGPWMATIVITAQKRK